MAAERADKVPRPPPGPRIPREIVDPPTQRLYIASLFILLQAYKLSDALWPASQPVGLQDELDLNTTLAQWVAIDLVAVAVIAWLRVPRLDWGWKARWGVRAVLVGIDWLLFGRWTFAASFFLPAFLKSLLLRSLSTTERTVRLASVYGSEKTHLGGQFTVHILAVSTAFLNPLSTVYCRHPSPSKSHSEPTLVPLILNNTTPASLSYTLTTFSDPPTSQQYTIPASALVRHAHGHHHHHLRGGNNQGRRAISNAEDDDLALASEWALVPSSPSANKGNAQALRHRLPADSALASQNAGSNPSDPFNLSPTESLYYLPITQLGSVRLDSITDTEGHAIRIRRKRSSSVVGSSATSGFDETRILRCPTAGFSLSVPGATGEQEEHRCFSPSSTVAQSFPLGLTVSGQAQPLKLRWHSREGDPLTGIKRDEALEGIVGLQGSGGADEVIAVPMNVTLARPGRTTFYLDSVTDGVGNEVSYSGLSSTSSASSSPSENKSGSTHGAPLIADTVPSRSVVVHRPPEAAFAGECAKGEEVSLLQGGKKKLVVKLTGVEAGEATDVTLRFTPPEGEDGAKGKGWEKTVEARGAKAEIEVNEPGVYEVVGVSSRWCGGAVLVPNACTLVLQPVPTLTPTFTPLTDVCSSEIGLLSTLHLTGAPPFTVHYAITRLASPSSNRPQTKTYTKRITHSREELRLEAPGPGEWEYRFQKVSDRYYGEGRLLKGKEFARRQTVFERGDAKWRDVERGRTVHSCEGETVQVEVELSGNAPWDVEYSVVGQKPVTLSSISSSPHSFSVTIPPQIAKQGGQFALSIESVRDGNGCKRPLAVADLQVEVKRTKPTARFHGKEGERSVVLREGETAKIPLRLTGEGPWTVTYQPPSRDGQNLSPITFRAQQANVDINIRDALPGTYKLLSVRDQFCPGDVFEPSWSVNTLPRPTLRLGGNIGNIARNGSVIRAGVCANVADSFPVYFAGKAPYKASYTLTKGSHHGGEKREHTLQAIQPRADLTLFTAEPGHHTYHFTGVGDSLYTSPDAAGLVAPKGGASGSGKNGALLRVEQDVFALPTAYFAHGPKHGFCVNDELASRGADDLILHLTGAAPFEVELEVREEGRSSSAKRFTVPAVKEHKWPVSLPVGLSKANPHSISIRRVKDANGCETLVDPSSASSGSSSASLGGVGNAPRTSLTLPVAEIATIKPVTPQVDHCVGDFLDFTVQGQPPFTVVYEFEGKKHAVPLTSGKFQRVAAKEGEFRIVSVGHGDDQCRSKEVDIVKHIHPLPSARVQTGDSVVVDLREGEQTEIVFLFTGTAPFSFTYSRRAPQDRSKDRTVLETHTVTGIQEHSYSIFTSQEGTWSVSYVADAHCAYPPSQKSAVVKA
ncbi:hypothetical protein JCM6882_005288 [Rhodosporidiobolus microsporus]